MSHIGEQTSAEVAEEAEHERADLAHTLDQLRENLQPRNVVDEVMSHAEVKSAFADLSTRATDMARSNPIATALIGLGVAMMVGLGRRTGQKPVPRSRGWTASDRFPSAASPDARLNPAYRRDTPQTIGAGRPTFGSGPTRPARAPYPSTFDDMSSAYQPVRPPMSSLSALKHPTSSLSRLFDEQPLILAALGVAVGAAVGAALPSTDIESQWMGDASESMRQNASAAARQQFAQLKATADQTFEQMKATAADHGATAENVSSLVQDLGSDVRKASHDIGQNAADLRFRA